MFTGIISTVGEVLSLEAAGGDWRLTVKAGSLDFADVQAGDSIAVSGVCLTVSRLDAPAFSADVSNETMQCTSLGQLTVGAQVNLEKAMLPSTRFGGHIVSGHVDGLATLISRTEDGRSLCLCYKAPEQLARYIVKKGSVCLDGVSLTVNEVNGEIFEVNVIPHTAAVTTVQLYQPGTKVNLEVDLIGRYLERLLESTMESGESGSGITMELLRRHGFHKDA